MALSADPDTTRLPDWLNVTALHESVCSLLLNLTVVSSKPQFSSWSCPSTRPTASRFWDGWNEHSYILWHFIHQYGNCLDNKRPHLEIYPRGHRCCITEWKEWAHVSYSQLILSNNQSQTQIQQCSLTQKKMALATLFLPWSVTSQGLWATDDNHH